MKYSFFLLWFFWSTAFAEVAKFPGTLRIASGPISTPSIPTIVALNDTTAEHQAKLLAIQKDGVKKWDVKLDGIEIQSLASVAPEMIVVTGILKREERGVVIAVNLDGSVRWRFTMRENFFPADNIQDLSDGKVRVAADSTVNEGVDIYIIDIEKGET